MTNDKIPKNVQIRMTKHATAQLRAFGHLGFGFLWSLVIGHWSFKSGSWSQCALKKASGLSMNRDSQTRMTNDETRRNDEIRRTKHATAQLRAFGHLGFGFLWSLVIGHWSFNALFRSVGFRRCRFEGTAPYRRI